MDEIKIEIADICISLFVDELELRSRVRAHYADFLSETGVPEVCIAIKVESGTDFIPMGPGSWIVETEYNNSQLDYMSYREKGFVDFLSGEGHLILRPNASIENFLRVLYAWLCLEHEALLVHSAGVLRNGNAYVFFGPSGSGKTTITRFSLDHIVLSDDLVIVKKKDGRYYACGVPFRGEAMEAPRTNACGELGGLFRLQKGPEHRIKRLASAKALGELVGSIPFVVDKGGRAGAVMTIAADIIDSVPHGELWFHRDPGFWSVIDDYC